MQAKDAKLTHKQYIYRSVYGKKPQRVKRAPNLLSYKGKQCNGDNRDGCPNKVQVLWIKTHELSDLVLVDFAPMCWQCASRMRKADNIVFVPLTDKP